MANFQNRKCIFSYQPGMITIYNRQRVILEGVERIVFCDSEKMIIKNRHLTKITGKNLRLLELGNRNIAIVGEIHLLAFDQRGQ